MLAGRTKSVCLVMIAAVLGVVTGAQPAGAETSGTQSLDELYAKAKSEGAFVLYVGGRPRHGKPWRRCSTTAIRHQCRDLRRFLQCAR